MIWTNEEVAQLREMIERGLKQREIARAFGLSHNTVAGRMHRLGLKLESANAKKRRAIACAVPEEIVEDIAAAVVVDAEPVLHVPSLGVALDVAGVIACRYPLWDKQGAPDFSVCGEPTPIGSAWCSYHRRLVYPERRAPLAAVTAP